MSGPTRELQAENIIGDILAPGTHIPRTLKVIWPSTKLEQPGQMEDRDAVQPKPTVYVDPPIENDTEPVYTLLMVDPDLTHRHDTRFGQVRHWLVTKCSIGPNGEVIDPKDTTISPWVGPAPIPAHYVTGKPHPSRYTFILCRSKNPEAATASGSGAVNLDPNSLRVQYEGTPGELGKPSQDIIDRMKFNTQNFIEKNNLEVIAATFMLVEGNVKSAVTNAGLTATAVAHKLVGK